MKKRLLGLLLALVLMLSFNVTAFTGCNCGGGFGGGCIDEPIRAIIPADYDDPYEDDQEQYEDENQP